MLAKHPLELGEKKFSKEELEEALRLSIIAELDAINLYKQLARAVSDDNVRKVFEDIAKEEKTHVGEFLALLKSIDPEQVEELGRGAAEVEELTGIKAGSSDPPAGSTEHSAEETVPEVFTREEWAGFIKGFRKAVDEARVLRRHIPLYTPGRGVEAVVVERITVKDDVIAPADRVLIPLSEISVKFRVSQRSIDHARRRGEAPDLASAFFAASRLGYMEDKLILDSLLGCRDAEKISISDWRGGGAAVDEVSEAVSRMHSNGVPGPYVLVVSPDRYAGLVAVHERTGVMELTRLKQLVSAIVPTPQMPPGKALLVSANPSVIDLAIGADTVVDYMGPEDDQHLFRAWETLAVRVKYPKAVMIMEASKSQ